MDNLPREAFVMTARSNREGRRQAGFSLLELLVAVAVLALMVVLLGQILNVTVRTTNLSQQQMNATRAARTVLDALQEDLDNIVIQHEASTVFVKADGLNSKLTLVTRRRGPAGAADLRFFAVTYELQGSQMVRNVAEINWSDANLVSEAFQAPDSNLSADIADGILRFEAVLQLDDGTFVPLSTTGSWSKTKWNDVAIPGGFTALQIAKLKFDTVTPRVRALTVGIVSIDPRLLQIPGSGTIASTLGPAVATNTPLEAWNSIINTGGLSAQSPRLAGAVRTLQTTFPLRQ